MTSRVTVRAASDAVGLRRESTIDAGEVPLWLARVHRAVPAGAAVRLSIDGALGVSTADVLEGAGFSGRPEDAVAEPTLPDLVRDGLTTLVCGLNPGHHSVAEGYSFAGPGNRFWSAALDTGLVSTDRDVEHAVTVDGVGFTDLAKRSSRRADEITAAEFRAGAARLERLVAWLRPHRLLVVGLTGWQRGVDRSARAGWQAPFGGQPVYVMPSTSGLNTHETLATLRDHLREAQGPPSSGRSRGG